MESSAANIKAPVSRPTNLRAYLAGTGATAALIGGAVVVFIAVAAFVGFNGLPFGADDSSDATVELIGNAPEAAAAAAPAAGAVAATPAVPGPAATAEILAALPPGTIAPGGPGDPAGPNGQGTVPIDPNVSLPPGTPVPATQPGAVGGVVGGLDNTTQNLGLGNLGLGGLTDGVTAPIDKTLNDTLNGVGGALGNPNLGNDTTGALNDATSGALGNGGLVNGLLGSNK